jgi:glycosyltransferase involved in cell wall biosynthesis
MMSASSNGERRLRVLHANFGIERGGIETWLSSLIRQFDPQRYSFALAYHRGRSASMQAEFRALGVTLHSLPAPRSPASFVAAFRQLLRDAGPFDVVHSHLNFPGLLMPVAVSEGVPVRVVQSHVSPELMTPGLLAGGFVRTTNWLFRRSMSIGIGVSANAARTLFGARWRRDSRVVIEPCGIDLAGFEAAAVATDGALRAELGIPQGAWVVALVGRLGVEKNHAFALRVAALLAGRDSGLCLLLIGDGPERKAWTELAEHLGIAARVIFAGERRDVPALLTAVVDVMLLPSLTEGSPLTVIEAQAAGVPAVTSLAVPEAAVLVEGGVQRVDLAFGERAWADAVFSVRNTASMTHGMASVRDSPYDIRHNVRFLDACYRGLGASQDGEFNGEIVDGNGR